MALLAGLTGLIGICRIAGAQGSAAATLAVQTRAVAAIEAVRTAVSRAARFDWRAAAFFKVTHAMRVSMMLSLSLGALLGIGVGVLSGLEPTVVIAVSASMALGCAFVMSFAILHGVNVLRAACFAAFVSACLPAGFGVGFGVGCLVAGTSRVFILRQKRYADSNNYFCSAAVFMGLENPSEVREKTHHFVTHFDDFARVVFAFTLEIL